MPRYAARPARAAPLPLLILPLALLAACTGRSEVVELEPGLFALSTTSASAAAAARLGVEGARRHCTERGGALEPVRTEIGNPEYRIAFRCPAPAGNLAVPAAGGPALPEVPVFRPDGGLL